MNKDWTGNKKSTFTTLGASNHSDHERADKDYYSTDPRCAKELLDQEDFNDIWECSCGEGHLSKEFQKAGKHVYSTDIVDRGYGIGQIDFLNNDIFWQGDIITNPPYSLALEFCQQGIKKLQPGRKMAMFLKLTFLEGQKRKKFFEVTPPCTVYVYSSRRKCALNGDFASVGSSVACYAWFVWKKGYVGPTVVKWID